MEKLNFRELYVLCELTEERLTSVNKMIVSTNNQDGKLDDESAAVDRELNRLYEMEKFELEILLEKLQALKREV